MLSWYLHWSLLHGWLPIAVDVLAFATFVAGVAWLGRPAWHWAAIAVLAGAGAVGLAAVVDAPARFGSTYPRSFLAWGALPLFALGAAAWQWRRVGWLRRTVTLFSIPALAAFGGMQINLHYGHVPTIGDLIGAPLPGQVEASRLLRPQGQDGSTAITAAMHPLPKQGLVASLDIPAPVSRFAHRDGYVWVPPAFFSARPPRLPVLMLISGIPGSPADWLRAGGALAVANDWAAAHGGIAPVMVLPDANGSWTHDTECVDGPRGQAETYLTVDVPRFMVDHFGVANRPEQWAVGGMSEGGTCALTLVARHPDRFSTFVNLSGDAAPTLGNTGRTIRELYGGSVQAWRDHDPTRWFAQDASMGVAGFIAVGSDDHNDVRAAKALTAKAHAHQLRLVTQVLPGQGHNWYAWKRGLKNAYPWVVMRLGRSGGAPA